MVNAEAVRLAISVAGALLVGYGGWLHYPPLGFASAGALLFATGVVGTLRAKS